MTQRLNARVLSMVCALYMLSPAPVQASGLGSGAPDVPTWCPVDSNAICIPFSTTTNLVVTVGWIVTTAGRWVFSSTSGTSELLGAFLMANETGFLSDLHMGGGETLTDLASLYGVEHTERAEFFQAVKSNRHHIIATMRDQDDAQRWVTLNTLFLTLKS